MGLPKLKTKKTVTAEEYLAFERDSESRHEFLDGEVIAMAGESLSHSRVCSNILRESGNRLKGRPCEALSPNMKVRTSAASLYAYPDLTIVCGEPQFHDSKKDVLINPRVIFEVLSPSTENYDRTVKFQRYRMGNETLTDYVLVSQERAFVEHFRKATDGQWLYRSFSNLSEILDLDGINCELKLTEIYDRVELLPEEMEEDLENV